MPDTAVVFGARNLGGAILDRLLAQGWQAAGVARSAETVARVEERGATGIEADASDALQVRTALQMVERDLGAPSLFVNAVSAARPPRSGGAFGGGPFAEASVEDFRGWAMAVAEQAFIFLSESTRALRASGTGGTIIQVTGGSSRRAIPGRGLWSAGAQATRAMVHAAAQELREDGIHVALLIVDATIESPRTEGMLAGRAPEESADQSLIAEAVEYLATQQQRAWTHELTLTPSGDRWLP